MPTFVPSSRAASLAAVLLLASACAGGGGGESPGGNGPPPASATATVTPDAGGVLSLASGPTLEVPPDPGARGRPALTVSAAAARRPARPCAAL